MEQVLFTPAALLSVLSQIDELQGKEIEVTECLDGKIQLRIDQSVYLIEDAASLELEVTDDVIEEVDELNEDAYIDLNQSGDVEVDFVTDIDDDSTTVQGGFLSELFKTLAVGGMVRLTAKMLSPKEQKLFDKYTEEHMTKAERDYARRNNVYQFRKRG